MIFPKTASVHQVQKNYRTLFNDVMQKKEPLIILNKNKPEVVIISLEQFEQLKDKAEKYELEAARKSIEIYQKEKTNKKLKKLSSLADLEK